MGTSHDGFSSGAETQYDHCSRQQRSNRVQKKKAEQWKETSDEARIPRTRKTTLQYLIFTIDRGAWFLPVRGNVIKKKKLKRSISRKKKEESYVFIVTQSPYKMEFRKKKKTESTLWRSTAACVVYTSPATTVGPRAVPSSNSPQLPITSLSTSCSGSPPLPCSNTPAVKQSTS